MWTRFPRKLGGPPPRGAVIWTPHALYYVDSAGAKAPGKSWFWTVVAPAVLKAVLTAIALGLLYFLIAAVAPDHPLPSGNQCPQDICGAF